jgi:hypothetical protein
MKVKGDGEFVNSVFSAAEKIKRGYAIKALGMN